MTTKVIVIVACGVFAAACSADSSNEQEPDGGTDADADLETDAGGDLGTGDASDAGGDTDPSVEPEGSMVFLERHEDGNTFACYSCHALEEPAADGIRRPGHQIGDAANRPSYKNGQLSTLLEAVNTCREEWMGAPAFEAADPRWVALEEFLADRAGSDLAPALAFNVVPPPDDVSGGDIMAGRELFNGACTVCHGDDAAGTERAPPLNGEFLTPELIATRIRTSGGTDSPTYDGLTGGRMPFWSEDRLSDAELRDLVAFVDQNDPDDPIGPIDPGGELRECDSTHERVGISGELVEFAHDVAGTVTVIDDCTVEITDFVYDGQGVDVRFYGAIDEDYANGFSMSAEDLRRADGYRGETLLVQLPEDRTLDEFNSISVWCVPVGVSFGDALLE